MEPLSPTPPTTPFSASRLLEFLIPSLAAAPSIEAALQSLLEEVCRLAHWECGQGWLPSSAAATGESETPSTSSPRLRYVAGWHAGSRRLQSFASHRTAPVLSDPLEPAVKAMRERRAIVLETLTEEPTSEHMRAARHVGFRAMVALPLVSGPSVVAVTEFFIREPSERDAAITAALQEASGALAALLQAANAPRPIVGDERTLLSLLVDSAMDAMVCIDESQRIILFNKMAEQVFRCPAQEALGQALDIFIPPVQREAHRRHIATFGKSDIKSLHMHNRPYVSGRRADGEEFPVKASISQLMVGGRKIYVAVLRDLTEEWRGEEARTARQAAEEASRAKSEFLSRMSHELRTPLNSIIGFSDLLKMEGLMPRQETNLHYIQQAGRHLLSLVNEVLDITSIESGKFTISIEPVQLLGTLRETLELVYPLASPRNVTLQIEEIPPSMHLKADKQRLKQVLLNLLSNAVKYNRDGGSVAVRALQVAGEQVRISVADTGIGIAAENIPRLFTPFERLGAERHTPEGTGLGLALTKRLVEAMGGAIGVESVEGQGSTFWIELPYAVPPDTTTAPLELIDEHVQELPSYAALLLYVEDNLPNVRLVERILEHRPGIRLLSVFQGSMALQMARAHKPNIILLDLHLPDMSGREVLEILKSDPEVASIPVIILSADVTSGSLERFLVAGAHTYLAKPLQVRLFLQTLDELLAHL